VESFRNEESPSKLGELIKKIEKIQMKIVETFRNEGSPSKLGELIMSTYIFIYTYRQWSFKFFSSDT
jgi:hypothetical protein